MAGSGIESEFFRKLLKLFYSPQPNSATELRLMLDEAIEQRYGPEQMLINKVGEKRLLEAEANFPGRATTPVPQQPEADEIINLTNSPAKTISDSPDTIMDSDDGVSAAGAGAGGSTLLGGGDEDVNLKEFGDLNCCVCGEMVFTATNRLIECSNCCALYHQECHKPAITEEEASEGKEHTWQCDACLNRPSTSRAAGIVLVPDEPMALVSKTKSSATSSRSSSTSNSSSPFAASIQADQPSTSAAAAAATATSSAAPVIASTSKHHHKSSRSHKEERPSSSSSKSGSSSSIANPPSSAASAGEKSSSHSKRSHSSKSSSSKSSAKHHESNSSKRKGK